MTKDKFKYAVGTAVLMAFLMIIYAICFKTIPVENQQEFTHTVAMIETSLGWMLGYYFGSSSGSQAKTEMLAKKSEDKPVS